MGIKDELLAALAEGGPMNIEALRESSPEIKGKNVQARLWELRRDGLVERREDGTYVALAEPTAPQGTSLVSPNGVTAPEGTEKPPRRSRGDVKGAQAAQELDEPLSGDEGEFQKLLKDCDVKKGINVVTRTVFRGDSHDLDHVTDVLIDAKAFINPGQRKMIIRYWSDYTEQDLSERLSARLDRTDGPKADDDKDAAVDELGVGWGIEKDDDGEWGPVAGGEMSQVQAVKAAAQMNVTRRPRRRRDEEDGDGDRRRDGPMTFENMLTLVERLKPDKGDDDDKIARLEERLDQQREQLAVEREERHSAKIEELTASIQSLAQRDPVTMYQKAKETVYAFEGEPRSLVTDPSPTVQLVKDVGDKLDKNLNRIAGLGEQFLLRNQGEYEPEHTSDEAAQDERAERLSNRINQSDRSRELGTDLFGVQQ
jgi:hypothetical protein